MVMKILEEIKELLPSDAKISSILFEGANIVLYTKDRDFFLKGGSTVKEIVGSIKKRVELRPDPSILMDSEQAEIKIREVIEIEAGVDQIFFDNERSIVIIEADKPGIAIGKQGANLREIKEQTHWVPLIRRKPAIRSKLIEDIRSVLYKNSSERKKFLNRAGRRIYDGWIRDKKHEWVRLTCLGASRMVGRSCFLLQTPESRVLLDCGIDVANDKEPYPNLEAPEFKIDELDAVIITHSHIDHSGLVPYLYKFGYKGPVYCTEPTRDVMALLALDAVKIMRNEGREPIYTSEDVKEMVKHCITLNYEEVADITPDLRLTLYNAGHILGAALVHIHIGNGLHNFVYTGDLKFARTQLLEGANWKFPRLETLMMESTYGGRDNILPNPKEGDRILGEIIKTTVQRGGKVLMPVLGTGRAQDVIVMVENLISTGVIDEIPVYIDGMVWDVTAIHTAYPEFLNKNIRNQIFHKDNNPFLQPYFKRIGSQKERMEVIEYGGPCLILATSGMLVGGPSVEYLKHLADNDKNALVFSCYQGEGSLGKRIQNGLRELVTQKGTKQEITPLKMEVHKIEISDHADRKELMGFVNKCSPRPKKVIVIHGESSRTLDLARSIHKQNRIETVAPRILETIRLK